MKRRFRGKNHTKPQKPHTFADTRLRRVALSGEYVSLRAVSQSVSCHRKYAAGGLGVTESRRPGLTSRAAGQCAEPVSLGVAVFGQIWWIVRFGFICLYNVAIFNLYVLANSVRLPCQVQLIWFSRQLTVGVAQIEREIVVNENNATYFL